MSAKKSSQPSKRIYKCSKCGQPKKGHVCPLDASDTSAVDMSMVTDPNVSTLSAPHLGDTTTDSMDLTNDGSTILHTAHSMNVSLMDSSTAASTVGNSSSHMNETNHDLNTTNAAVPPQKLQGIIVESDIKLLPTKTKAKRKSTGTKKVSSRKKQTKDEPLDSTKPTHLVTIRIPSKFVIPVQCRSREAPVKTVPPPYYLLPEFSPQLTISSEDELYLTVEQIGSGSKRGWRLDGSEFLKSYCTAMDLEAKTEIEPQPGKTFTLLSFNIDGSDLPGCPYTSDNNTGDSSKTTTSTTESVSV
mmetsp:Transcript_6182/g.23373  ORF Transcript_6182/g.23373 Transcript_6182/m.23373 type:complete len:301 (-) Transcript_6182:165-1067(-)|eukprot:CAMPEP_0117435238 /NCGR_PEP_ID=MMETSP0759-20121206/373_1 /TAXON_ID=63605 /ORGANISM="Percolomonas cosmopolitus, Strain WS" /LENGTH=300 /DNA_ID=CAMNT_0005226769 /DNA_START=384 /DNA_END=1286 /DNA_ORIENTATION=+